MLALSSMLLLPTTAAYMAPGCAPMRAQAAARVPAAPVMDETIIEKALLGELEEEGAENVFMSEVGWASYLDKNAGSSYNMNQRPSMAEDGYFTSSILSNPVEVFSDWVESVKRAAGNPFETAFPTISNDQSGARSYPKGLNEVNARTIKPKVKDFSKDKRIVGIPGFNNFGTPSSKGLPWPFNSDSD